MQPREKRTCGSRPRGGLRHGRRHWRGEGHADNGRTEGGLLAGGGAEEEHVRYGRAARRKDMQLTAARWRDTLGTAARLEVHKLESRKKREKSKSVS